MSLLSVDVGGLKMKNPVAVASGTFGYGREYQDYIDISFLGAVIVKGTTLTPRPGKLRISYLFTPVSCVKIT